MAEKKDGDSLFWVVDRALAECMAKVAVTHAEKGGEAVMLISRKLTAEQEGKLSFAGVKMVSTRGKG